MAGKLIVDAGSTKTEWMHSDGRNWTTIFTAGINPIVQSRERVMQIVAEAGEKISEVECIAYYGAGISHPNFRQIVLDALNVQWPMAHAEVEHDLLGAARALLGKAEGIAVILGTGANSCHYANGAILKNVPALGYILGDEGSGASMGKRLAADYCYGLMPTNLMKEFQATFGFEKSDIIENVYRRAEANRWLAQFAPFLSMHIDEDYCQRLVRKVFADFIRTQISQYPQVPVRAVGSVAFAFRDIFAQCLGEAGFEFAGAEKSPMQGLVKFYSDL